MQCGGNERQGCNGEEDDADHREEAEIPDRGDAVHHQRTEADEGGEGGDHERYPHALESARHHQLGRRTQVHLLVVPRHYVDRVGAADDQQQRRQHERAQRDRLVTQHHDPERPGDRHQNG